MSKYLLTSGIKINIEQNKKEGDAVIFIHGNSLSSEFFKYQMQSSELQDYRLITFDWPGHGSSDKAIKPESTYNFKELEKIIPEVINILNIKNPIIIGHSFGGHIAINAIPLINDIKALVIFGTPPFSVPLEIEKAFLPNECAPFLFTPELTVEQAKTLSAQYSTNNNFSQDITNSILKTDPMFRAIVGQQIMQGKTGNEMQIIESFNKPIGIFHGENDLLVNYEYFQRISKNKLWKESVQVITNAGHCPQIDNYKEFNNKLESFLKDLE